MLLLDGQVHRLLEAISLHLALLLDRHGDSLLFSYYALFSLTSKVFIECFMGFVVLKKIERGVFERMSTQVW